MTDPFSSVLVLSMIGLMAVRSAPPLAAKVDGELKLEVPIRLLFRVLDQRVNIMAILAVLILGSGLIVDRWISHELFLFAVIAMIAILLIPRRYRFTTGGVSPNRASFRAWSEFDTWQTSGNVIRLEGTQRFSSLKLYVAGSDRDGVLKLVSRYIPRSAAHSQAAAARAGRGVQRLTRSKGETR